MSPCHGRFSGMFNAGGSPQHVYCRSLCYASLLCLHCFLNVSLSLCIFPCIVICMNPLGSYQTAWNKVVRPCKTTCTQRVDIV